jgi:hypothetical protein
MGKVNKQFEYKGYKFNTSVELNTKAEKHIGGRIWHTVITNCLGGNNYYDKEEIVMEKSLVSDTNQTTLELCIIRQRYKAEEYIDKLTYTPKTEAEELLEQMGFA